VIAGGDDVRAQIEELVGDRRCNAETAGGILPIDDYEIDRLLVDDVSKMLPYDPAAGLAKYVSHKQNPHVTPLSSTGRPENDAGTATNGDGYCFVKMQPWK
jgi:hypothetical protein